MLIPSLFHSRNSLFCSWKYFLDNYMDYHFCFAVFFFESNSREVFQNYFIVRDSIGTKNDFIGFIKLFKLPCHWPFRFFKATEFFSCFHNNMDESIWFYIEFANGIKYSPGSPPLFYQLLVCPCFPNQFI